MTPSKITVILLLPQVVKPAPVAPEVSELATNWVEDYPDFNENAIFNGAALAVNKALVLEGFNPNTPDFYEELNSRLEPNFPEVFGIEGESSVEYNQEDESSDGETLTDPQESSKSKTPTRKTPRVSGASRSPNSSASGKSKSKNTVRMTEGDQILATRWDMDLQKMALRKKHIETNKGEDGYTPIKIS